VSFYYFVASLPALTLAAPPPQSFAAFRAEVARLLPPSVGRELDAVVAGGAPGAGSGFASAWHDHEVQLRNAVARARALRRNEEVAPFLKPCRGFSLAIEQAVGEAYGKPNPLERELALDQIRWSSADELARTEAFGLEAVLAYGVKLKMVERWAALSDEAGRIALLAAVKQVRAVTSA
jgi:hypothetical protein